MLSHWAMTPVAGAVLLALVLYEAGLARLRARRPPSPREDGAAPWHRWRARRAWLFRGGVALALSASSSPLAYWGMRDLSLHMIDHILLMFAAPAAMVAGGPVVPLCHALPLRTRVAALRWLRRSRTGSLLGGAWKAATRPVVGFVAVNAAMLAWHAPRLFDAAMSSWSVHDLLMEPSFVLSGILFWRSVYSSHPYGPRARPRTQLLMVAGTNVEMVLLAISMSVLTHHAWYTMGSHVPAAAGMAMAASAVAAFHAQQTAAGVLWICGDFWALPSIVVIVQRVIRRDGSLLAALEHSLGERGARPGPPHGSTASAGPVASNPAT